MKCFDCNKEAQLMLNDRCHQLIPFLCKKCYVRRLSNNEAPVYRMSDEVVRLAKEIQEQNKKAHTEGRK